MEEIVKRHENKLLRAAAAITGSAAEAEDVVQDVFLKLFEKRPEFASLEHEKAWLIRVTVNASKSRLRSAWFKRTVPLLDIYPAQNEAQQSLVQSVFALPAKYRTVIHLFYYEGYATKEIAEITRQSEPAVRQQLSRARSMLKHVLEEEGHEGF